MKIKHIKTKTEYDEAVHEIKRMTTAIGVDTETTGVDPYLSKVLLIQIGNKEYQFVFDVFLLKCDGVDFTEIKTILENPYIIKIGHNIGFDYKILKQLMGIELNNVFDTMIAEQLLTKGIKFKGFGLKDVLEKYGFGELDKEVRETFISHLYGTPFTEEQITYAGMDIVYLIPLYEKFLELLKRDGMLDLMHLENETVLVTGDLELNGILLDKDAWQILEDEAKANRDKLEQELKTFIPDDFDHISILPKGTRTKLEKKLNKQETLDFDDNESIEINFSSPSQMLGYLKATTGIEPSDTNEKTLYKTYRQPDGSLPEVVQTLLKYREYDKLVGTYGMKFYNENVHSLTGRIHARFNQLGTESGRYSSDKPNMQNLPGKEAYRNAFKARPGFKMICADLAQFELRVLAELSEEQSWIDEMQDVNGDLHKFVASRIYGKPKEAITKLLRTVGKNLNFGI